MTPELVLGQPVLADERVFHAGDGVAAVAAVTEQIAAEAIEKITVEYARREYGVALDPTTLEILPDETARLRLPR